MDMEFFQIGSIVITKSILNIIMVCIAIGLTFLVIRLLIKWLVSLQAVKLISYIICSIFALLVSLFLAQYIGDLEYITFLKMVLQGMAVFGGVLFLLYSIHYLFRGKQKQKSV